jgi:hypothetical protein
MLIGSHQVVFEECFQNTNKVQMMSRFSDEIGHHSLVQGSLKLLGGERRTSYITALLRQILEFLHVQTI